ncbi:MAG: CotH kinase family protein [Clostridiales bacterium]|nr:CotH kinase family protein [Clostridiales bacterium]
MLSSRKINLLSIIFTAVCTAAALILVINGGFESTEYSKQEYTEKLFGENVVNLDITADEDDWNYMVQNKMSKPYISCDVEINGDKFEKVGIRPKGNSSLSSASGQRISFRLDFDHYIKNQSCYGLEEFVFNNTHSDKTFMKDYIAYSLMSYMEVEAPLCCFANITLNGEAFGVYIAAEVYDDDYLERTSQTGTMLYSVKSSGLDEYEKAVIDPETCRVISTEGIVSSADNFGPGEPPGGGMGMPPMPPGNGENFGGDMAQPPENTEEPPGNGGGGGSLEYTDNNTESYKNIFANSVNDNAKASDYARVIRALVYLNKEDAEKEELEKYWNTDEILRYLAVHTFMVNTDSYNSNMAQNYYIVEKDGVISILPWDYNLSFGSFSMGSPGRKENKEKGDSVETALNFAIDTPVSGVDMKERPLISVLLGVDEYKEKYHLYLDELTDYVTGEYIVNLKNTEEEIYPLIENDATSSYSAEEQKKAFKTVCEFMTLRCESIKGQLNGQIASETDLQEKDTLVTAAFSLSDMGSMGGGPERGEQGEGDMPQPPEMGGEMQPPDMGGGMQPPPNMNGNMQPPPNMGDGMQPPGMGGGMGMPPGMQNQTQETADYGNLYLSLIIMGIGLFTAIIFRRKA